MCQVNVKGRMKAISTLALLASTVTHIHALAVSWLVRSVFQLDSFVLKNVKFNLEVVNQSFWH